MATLELVFKGSDETKAAVNDVAGGLHNVGEAADTASSKGGGLFSNLLSTAGGFLAANVVGAIAGQFTDFIGGAISDAREANVLMGQTEAVIKSTGGAAGVTAEHIADVASALSAAAGKSLFGDDQIQQAENLFLTFTNIKGSVLDAATAISVDMAQALGGEPKAQAIQLGKALNDPINGITALTRVGVTFTDQQKEQIKTMQEAGDMAGAQKVILDELNKEFGGSAEAAAKADGGWAQMQDRLGELGESVGQLLLPVIGALVGFLNDSVMPAVESVVNGIGPFIESFQAAGASSGELGGILNALGEIWKLLAEVIGLEVELIKAIVIPIFTEIQAFIAAHGEEINAVLSAAWTIIKTTIETTLTIIKGVLTAALQVIHGDWSGAWETIKTMFADVWKGIETILTAELEIAKTILSGAWEAIKGAVESAWEGIKGAVDTAISGLVDTIMGFPDQVASVGNNLVQGIKSGFASEWDSFVDWVLGQLDGLKDQVLSFFGISSPSSVMAEEVGEPIVLGILQGMQDLWPTLLGAVQGMGDDLVKQVQDIGEAVNDALASGFDATASIDRQRAKMLDEVSKFTGNIRAGVEAEMAELEKQTAEIQDPEEAKKFYQMRTGQILEIADLQKKLSGDMSDYDRKQVEQQLAGIQMVLDQEGLSAEQKEYYQKQAAELQAKLDTDLTDEERARLVEQMDLIRKAQQAEQDAFKQRQQGQSQVESLQQQIADLLNNEDLTSNPALLQLLQQLAALTNQLGGAGGGTATPVVLPTPAPMPGFAGPGAGAGAATTHVVISVDDRGLGWLKELIRVEVQTQTAIDSRKADYRLRTR